MRMSVGTWVTLGPMATLDMSHSSALTLIEVLHEAVSKSDPDLIPVCYSDLPPCPFSPPFVFLLEFLDAALCLPTAISRSKESYLPVAS